MRMNVHVSVGRFVYLKIFIALWSFNWLLKLEGFKCHNLALEPGLVSFRLQRKKNKKPLPQGFFLALAENNYS